MVIADVSSYDSNVAGTYRIHTSSTLSDFTEVSGAAIPIFTDTTSTGFAATSIGAATTTQIGVASTVQSFFLMRRDGTDVDPVVEPLSINSDGDIQEYVDGESTFIVIEDGGTDGGGSSGNGGSGVVILRVRTAAYPGTTTGSPTVTTDGEDTIIKYTGSGTYTA